MAAAARSSGSSSGGNGALSKSEEHWEERRAFYLDFFLSSFFSRQANFAGDNAELKLKGSCIWMHGRWRVNVFPRKTFSSMRCVAGWLH